MRVVTAQRVLPHLTQEYSQANNRPHLTTVETAEQMIRTLPLDADAQVVVIGDKAYESSVVEKACEERGYLWVFLAKHERVYQGPTGRRAKLRSRLKDWASLPLSTIRLRASTWKYAGYQRLSKWPVGPKMKPRFYYAYQEKQEVRNVGFVKLVFSIMKSDLEEATPDDVKILLTNAT
jgi:hypothetical protein